jgi:NitT/TauT family transport system substrate-binding protein
VQTINQVATGAVNFATAGTDSVVNAVARHLPIKIVAPSMVTPPYSLITLPSITSWQQLKGKTVILATKQEITAIAFRMMAKANHLDWNNDFSIALAGSTPARFAALKSGNVQGAMLGQPFNFMAEAQGMRTLDESYNYMKVWMFDGIAVNPNWAATHREEIVAFLRALRKASEYAYTHRQEAIDILQAETRSDRATIEKTYDLDFGKWHAFSRNEQIDPKDVQGVIDGVVQQGVLPSGPPLSDVVDLSYGREAAR